MKARALAIRILHQIRHDRRTLALMMVAPLLMLTLMYYIFEGSASTPAVAVINASADYTDNLEASNITVVRMSDRQAQEALEAGQVVASIDVRSGRAYVQVDGSQTGDARVALAAIQAAGRQTGSARTDLQSEVKYLYGYEDASSFDTYGAAYIGFIIFFFTFLVAGISFLQERTSGTLEKLLSMPIKRGEIVVGYVMGFGTITVLQSFLISWFSVYILDLALVGSFALVLLITLLTAMSALTFGIMCSTAANSEFQMMQFIPVVIIPQVFFSGLFKLSPWLEIFEKAVPLYYVTDALTLVMVKGSGLDTIAVDLAVITGFCIFFMAVNTRLLRKYRRI